MTTPRRRATTVAALAAVTLTLGACAQGTGGTNADIDFDSEATLSGELTVLGFGAGDEIATVRVGIAEKALGADAPVSLVEGDLDIQQLLSAIAAGDPPSLIYADRDQIGSLAARGAIIDLDDCIEGEGIDTEQYVDSALDQVTFDGSVYGIPEFGTVQLTMANSALLDAAGLTLDDVNGSDWSAVTDAALALRDAEADPAAGIGLDPKLPEFFPLWAKANGADLISDDGRTAQLDDPKVVEALEFSSAIYDSQGGFAAVKAIRDSADFFGAGNQFATGTLGSMWMEQWYVNVLGEVSPDATLAFDTFRTPEGEPLAFAAGSAWAIPSGSDNPAAACRFARTMTETDSWVAAAEERRSAREADGTPFTGVLTANEDADAAIRDLVPTTGSAQWDAAIEATYLANENTFALPANPADAEFTAAWQDAVNRVLNGQATARQSLEQAQEEAQSALDEAWSDLESD